jgi:hypothetical protein
VTKGYCNKPEINQQTFKDGWFFTGDLGKKDEIGHIYITGRKQIFIDTGGYKVDPLEPNKPVKTGEDIWQAIASILDLQNQAPDLVPVSRNEHPPLSFSQERLWFIHQLQPDSSTYNVSLAFRLQGLLNICALEHSLNEIIQRHEALRTTFLASENKPVQVIAPSLNLMLPVVDLRELPEIERETQVLQLVKNEVQQPFDLEQGSLLRSSLVQLHENELVTTTITSWVNSTPERSAVCQGSRIWKYGELGKSSQALVRVLLSHGIERGNVVALYGTSSY